MFYIEKEYFNPHDTLFSGQVFRFENLENKFLINADNHVAFLFDSGEKICVDGDNDEFFKNYFDIEKDYSKIYLTAKNSASVRLKAAAEIGKGIRLLKQSKFEALISFIISQNNNIPRIRSIIDKICKTLGTDIHFKNQTFKAFPLPKAMAEAPLDFYKSIGAGYRAEYIKKTAELVSGGLNLNELDNLSTKELKSELLKIKGVGNKVCDCVMLFGFCRYESFPVDTWIEKVYREDFSGTITDRAKISSFFSQTFGQYSGYIQQYLFYAKREKKI